MDFTFLVAWEWFQWIAIRFAIFMGLLTLGPSIGLIVFDLLLYAYRTTFDRVLFIGRNREVPLSSETNKGEIEVKMKVFEEVQQSNTEYSRKERPQCHQ